MRNAFAVLSLAVVLLVLPPEGRAQSGEKDAQPTPTPTPAEDVSEEMPTVTDEAGSGDEVTADESPAAAPAAAPDAGWGADTVGRTLILGLRAGMHTYAPGEDAGFAFEFTGAMPIAGPFYAAGTLGYHTGYYTVNNYSSFFDAQFGSVEAQYRRNLGPMNLFTGLGLGFLVANTADIVRADGLPVEDRGSSMQAHAILGAHVPVGRAGVVGFARYGVAPVAFEASRETAQMGGLTLGVGVDFGF